MIPQPYYRNVARPLPHLRTISALCWLLLAISGCDRGAAPRNIGKLAPDFSVADNGTTLRLSQFRGQVVMLNFWASWCPPCVEEMPSLLDLHHRMPQVVILAVSVDTDAEAYQNFLRDHHVDLLDVRDPSQNSNHLYGTVQFPETYVIDRSGHLRRKFIGAQDFTSPEILSYLTSIATQK